MSAKMSRDEWDPDSQSQSVEYDETVWFRANISDKTVRDDALKSDGLRLIDAFLPASVRNALEIRGIWTEPVAAVTYL